MKYFGIIDKNVAAIFQLQWKIGNISDMFLQYSVLCGILHKKPHRMTLCLINLCKKKFVSFSAVRNNFMTKKCPVLLVTEGQNMNRLYFVLTPALSTRVPSATMERRHPMIVEDIMLFCDILTDKLSNWLDRRLDWIARPKRFKLLYKNHPCYIKVILKDNDTSLYSACCSVIIIVVKFFKNRKTGRMTSDTGRMIIVHSMS